MRSFIQRLLIPTAGLSLCGPLASAAGDSKDFSVSVAARQVRRQGYPCGAGISAEKDQMHPYVKGGWILRCDNAVYHVHLVPRRGAKVERVQ